MIAIRLGELRPAYITPVSANVQITESLCVCVCVCVCV